MLAFVVMDSGLPRSNARAPRNDSFYFSFIRENAAWSVHCKRLLLLAFALAILLLRPLRQLFHLFA
jgi:hypothetical protein